MYADTKEVKRRRERDRYANNKDEILKRRRHLRDLKKESMDAANVENIPSHTQAKVGNSGIIQYMPSEGLVFYTSTFYSGSILYEKADFLKLQ
jgi:hypothetical protein